MTVSTLALLPWNLNDAWSLMTVRVAWRSRSMPGVDVVPVAQPTSGWPAES